MPVARYICFDTMRDVVLPRLSKTSFGFFSFPFTVVGARRDQTQSNHWCVTPLQNSKIYRFDKSEFELDKNATKYV